MATRPMAVKLDPETKERLTRLAAAKKRSPHWLVKEAVREYTEREELLEKLRQESLDRWESYGISGDSVSNEAVMAWLDTWGSENEAEWPKCENYPDIIHPVENLPAFHDLIVPFGSGNYVVRYRIEQDAVYVVSIRHSKESGFKS